MSYLLFILGFLTMIAGIFVWTEDNVIEKKHTIETEHTIIHDMEGHTIGAMDNFQLDRGYEFTIVKKHE